MTVPTYVIGPKRDILRLQEGSQSSSDDDDTGQKLADSKARSSTGAALSASGARGTGGGARGSSGSFGRNRRRGGGGRTTTGTWAGTRTANREGAGAVDLILFVGGEVTSHSGQLELGGKGQSGVLRVFGILEGERLNSDEARRSKKKSMPVTTRDDDRAELIARTIGQSRVQSWGRGRIEPSCFWKRRRKGQSAGGKSVAGRFQRRSRPCRDRSPSKQE